MPPKGKRGRPRKSLFSRRTDEEEGIDVLIDVRPESSPPERVIVSREDDVESVQPEPGIFLIIRPCYIFLKVMCFIIKFRQE